MLPSRWSPSGRRMAPLSTASAAGGQPQPPNHIMASERNAVRWVDGTSPAFREGIKAFGSPPASVGEALGRVLGGTARLRD